MPRHNIERLEAQVRELNKALSALAFESELEQLIKHFHQPGWTTPAEFRLVTGLVEGIANHTKAIAGMKQVLLVSSKEIAEAGAPVAAAR
jgi:hypothetical protein